MTAIISQENVRQMASRWLTPSKDAHPLRILTDTTDFFRLEYGDMVVLGGKPYLVRYNAKEGRFGIDDDVKFWVKNAIDLKRKYNIRSKKKILKELLTKMSIEAQFATTNIERLTNPSLSHSVKRS